MDQVTQKFVMARMEELEIRLRDNKEYWQQVKVSNQAGKKFEVVVKKGEGVLKAYCDYEDELSKTNCIYSEEAYKLGFEDGILIGMEKKPDGRKSVLSLEDMTAMVAVYDSVQELKEIMLGDRKEYWEEGGVLATIESVYDIIEHAVCAEVMLMGEDEAAERVSEILDRKVAAEKRARELLGLS